MELVSLIHEFPRKKLYALEYWDSSQLGVMDNRTLEELDVSNTDEYYQFTEVDLCCDSYNEITLLHNTQVRIKRKLEEIRGMTLNELRKIKMEDVRLGKIFEYEADSVIYLVKEV